MMKSKLVSIVVIAWRMGFVAHIRFMDPGDDTDISANNTYGMDIAIDRYLRRKGIWA